jgi:two-component system invasion response regulator UvrY
MSSIYVVDDHGLVRESLCLALEQHGHINLGGCDNPTQAMADLLKLRPDVVLIDINLGLRSGFELLAEMQQRDLLTHPIVISLSSNKRDVAQAIRLGAKGYVLKGWPLAHLFSAIDVVSKGQLYYVGEVAEVAIQEIQTPSDLRVIDTLSARERQVVLLVVKGFSSAAIGEALHLSPKTVDSYRSRLMAKLQVPDLPALVRLAVREGLIPLDD